MHSTSQTKSTHSILKAAYGVALSLLIMLSLLGCGSSQAAEQEAQAILNSTSTAQAEQQAQQEATESFAATGTAAYEATLKAENEAATATADAAASATAAAEATRSAKATEAYIAKQTKTAEAVAQKTQQASGMFDLISGLAKDGMLTSTNGTYSTLEPFPYAWAQLNWYLGVPTGLEPRNFVLKTMMNWESASDKANWWNSGCGFVFRYQPNEDHYAVYLGLDGYLNFFGNANGNFTEFGRKYFKKVDNMKGQAELMMVANENHFTFFLDGEKILQKDGYAGRLLDGELQYTVVSGTNKDFGTLCEFSETEIWTLE